MRQRKAKGLLVALGALALAFAAVPAAAQTTIYEFYSPAPPPPSVQYCYTEGGHFMWDGFQYVWVPGETVCTTS